MERKGFVKLPQIHMAFHLLTGKLSGEQDSHYLETGLGFLSRGYNLPSPLWFVQCIH